MVGNAQFTRSVCANWIVVETSREYCIFFLFGGVGSKEKGVVAAGVSDVLRAVRN